MKVLLSFISILISFSLYAQQGPDYIIMRDSGDTIYCDIMEDKVFYRPKKGEIALTRRYPPLYYNGFHAIMARIGTDSLLFLDASQILGYYQHNSLVFENHFIRQTNIHPRTKGYYYSFDLGKKAGYVNAGYSFRYVLATEANAEMLEGYTPKFNSPYKIYACYLSDSDRGWIDAYILKKDSEFYFFGKWVHLRQIGKKLGIDPKLWRKGPGTFREKVLRFQFALNQLQN